MGQTTSVDGPVVLMADVPISRRAANSGLERRLLAEDIDNASHEAGAAGAPTGASKEVREERR